MSLCRPCAWRSTNCRKSTGLDIPIHVDGASGAFLAPFIHPDVVWDFRLPRVKSINASGHKFGLTPLGCGWVVWREDPDLDSDLVFNVNYLGGNMPTFALNFSRPGGQIVCQYYNFIRLGREGYRKIQQACADTGAVWPTKSPSWDHLRSCTTGAEAFPAHAGRCVTTRM